VQHGSKPEAKFEICEGLLTASAAGGGGTKIAGEPPAICFASVFAVSLKGITGELDTAVSDGGRALASGAEAIFERIEGLLETSLPQSAVI
jgi:hypothetical protein